MNRICLLLLALAALALSCSRAAHKCQVCDRDECRGVVFRVTVAGERAVETCCPRCGLHYLNSQNKQATAFEATDFSNGQKVDATKAMYVSGSDVNPCANPEARRDAYGCCAVKGFDRCMPSLIAFTTRADAQSFQKQHGGDLQNWEQISRANTP